MHDASASGRASCVRAKILSLIDQNSLIVYNGNLFKIHVVIEGDLKSVEYKYE